MSWTPSPLLADPERTVEPLGLERIVELRHGPPGRSDIAVDLIAVGLVRPVRKVERHLANTLGEPRFGMELELAANLVERDPVGAPILRELFLDRDGHVTAKLARDLGDEVSDLANGHVQAPVADVVDLALHQMRR